MKKIILGLVFILGSFSFFANATYSDPEYGSTQNNCLNTIKEDLESMKSYFSLAKSNTEYDSVISFGNVILNNIKGMQGTDCYKNNFDVIIDSEYRIRSIISAIEILQSNTNGRVICLKNIGWLTKEELNIVNKRSDLVHELKREEALEYAKLNIKVINDIIKYHANSVCSDINMDMSKALEYANNSIQIIKSAIDYNKKKGTGKAEDICQTDESILACNLGGRECPSQCVNEFQNTKLQDAISWMYQKGLTKYNTNKDFMSDDYLTREQASKFFSEFSKQIIGLVVDTNKKVSLKDIKKANPTLQSYIKEANQLGLFNGVKGNFFPSNKLTRAQAIAVIIRAYKGVQDENRSPRYTVYFNFANEYSLLTGLSFDFDSLDNTNIKRGEVALLLYRLNLYKQNVAK